PIFPLQVWCSQNFVHSYIFGEMADAPCPTSLQTEHFALQSNRRRAQIPARHVADAHRRTAPLPVRHYCVSRAISLASVWSLRPLSPRLETTRGAPRPLATSSALS